METLLRFLLLGYGVWLAVYLFLEKRRSRRRTSRVDVQPPMQRDDIPDIVGKSGFRMKVPMPTPATPVPNAATPEKEEEISEEDVTFAEVGEKSPARIPDEELDDVFTDLRIEEVMDGEKDDDEEPPVEGYAVSSGFEEINEAVMTAKNPNATEEARIHAGEVFSELNGTELFEMLAERLSSIDGCVEELMNAYLDSPVSGATRRKRAIVPAQSENFDIRDYV